LAHTVTPATVTVTPDSQNVTFGLPIPVLTAAYAGFVNGEGTNVLTTPASLTTTAGAGSPVGAYPITASAAAAANYIFDYAPGTLTVMAQPALSGAMAGATGCELTFPTLKGQMYQVIYAADLTDAVWTPVGDPVPGTGSSMSVTNAVDTTPCFYMLQIWRQ
jgi:hypothetical protein